MIITCGGAELYKEKHIVLAILLFFIGVVLGSLGSESLPLGLGVTGFWPAVVVQVAGSLWLGVLGVIIGAVFPFVSNTYAGAPLIASLLYLPSNIVQGLIPYLVFKYLHLDPSLHDPRSFAHFLWSGILLNNALGAVLATCLVIASGLHLFADPAVFARTWFLGNVIPMIFIGIPTLWFITPLLEKAGMIVKR